MAEVQPALSTSIQYLKGVGPRLSEVLAKKGIRTIEDALYFLPRTYEDRSRLHKVSEVAPDQWVTLFVKVVSAKEQRRGRQARFQCVVSDGSGSLVLNWFYAYPSLKDEFTNGSRFLVYGRIQFYQGMPCINHPDYERVEQVKDGKPPASMNFGGIVPVYSETEGITQKILRKVMSQAVRLSLPHLDDALPTGLRERLALPTLRESFVAVHFPPGQSRAVPEPQALRRIIFEEFFVLQLGLGLRKQKLRSERAAALTDQQGLLEKYLAAMPFELTGDQRKAIDELRQDLSEDRAMTRLLQGDVGSGKTVVALAASVLAAGAGFQSAIMAPTEILAQQHYRTSEKLLAPLGIKCGLLTHASASRSEVREAVASGQISFVAGTHALFQKQISFSKLGVVIIDEQHRFGVEQRNDLMKKAVGLVPHLLMTTATPIPRTLSLTLYGDLDLSVIREKPPGRQKVQTSILGDRQRPQLYQKIRRTVERGEQAYIIYPLVEASEKLDLKSATDMYEKLRREVFPEFSIALLHGRMAGEEKDAVLKDFKKGKFQILVSTTVIEVGIDVPNATLMVIEHPERLGLSQLHQLRGRVGRGKAFSECLLVAVSGMIGARLRVLERTDDGFEIAEEDLKIRGPGEFLGTQQHGLPGFRVGHILRDVAILGEAREEAIRILETDPHLQASENCGIRQMVESRWQKKIERLLSG